MAVTEKILLLSSILNMVSPPRSNTVEEKTHEPLKGFECPSGLTVGLQYERRFHAFSADILQFGCCNGKYYGIDFYREHGISSSE